MSSEATLPLPVPVPDNEVYLVNTFFNTIERVGIAQSLPKNTKSITRIQASVEVPITGAESVTLYVFRSTPTGYATILTTTLNSTTMPGYRTYYDYSDFIKHKSLTDQDRLAVTLVPNGAIDGQVKALTVKIDLDNSETFDDTPSTTFSGISDPSIWPV